MILVSGEALIDMLPEGEPDAPRLRPVPGGSPFNVALALGRLEVPVQFLCPFSGDAFGRTLARTLTDAGVDLSRCPRTEALTTLGFVTFDAVTRENQYAFYTHGTAGCALRLQDLPTPLPPEIEAIHVGSFSLAVEPFGEAIEALVTRHAGERLVSLDPNIRPFLISDRDRFRRRLEGIAARADLIKVSAEDLRWLHPGLEPEQAAARYRTGRTRLVVITMGADGAVGHTARHRVVVSPPRVSVVDTVGAGDTYQAALLAGLRDRGALSGAALDALSAADLEGVLRFAAAAAAINCTRAGCNPPRRSELADLNLKHSTARGHS